MDLICMTHNKFLSATCRADKSAITVTPFLFTPIDMSADVFLCRQTNFSVGLTCRSDFVAGKSASVNSA